MADRITDAMLERKIATLNKLVGADPEPYTRLDNGNLNGNVGTYFLSGAYGGVNVECMANMNGAINHPIVGGYMTKRQLWDLLTALIRGIEIGIAKANEDTINKRGSGVGTWEYRALKAEAKLRD